MYQDNKEVDIELDGETLFDPDNFEEMLQWFCEQGNNHTEG